MSDISTEALQRIAEAATPGPWSASHNGHYWQIDTERDGQIGDACASKFIHQNGSVGSIITEAQASFIAQENARLIALAPQLAAEVLELREALARRQWQSMDTAPKDGRHCILAVQSGPFVYAVQGTYDEGRDRGWFNAADIEAEPLCWMPNVLVQDEFLPWTDAFKARAALSPAPVVDAVKQGDAQ